MPSRSPAGETLTLDYEDGWAAVNRLIRQGKSWSGRELDCAYWNAGDGSFVDVSHTAGLAFAHYLSLTPGQTISGDLLGFGRQFFDRSLFFDRHDGQRYRRRRDGQLLPNNQVSPFHPRIKRV